MRAVFISIFRLRYHLLLFSSVTFGNSRSRWSGCSAVRRQLRFVAIGWGRGWGQRNNSWLVG